MAEKHLRKSDAIVIVGASRGIGENLARTLVEAGYRNLHLVARSQKKLEALRRDLERHSDEVSVRVHVRDMCIEKDLMALVHELQSENAFPRHWVLSVGGTPSGKFLIEPFESTPWEQIVSTVDLNFMAPMRIMHQVLPELMRPNSDGVVEPASVIALSSQAAHHARGGASVYAAAKHGLWGLVRSVAEEVRELGIRLAVVAPGMVDTELHPSHPKLDRSKMIPVEDVSRAILFTLECSVASAPFEVHIRPQRSPK
ncbi:MAG TPA: SDR family oxidoreductase [Bdellovibrionota bacterium]|jgi:short-subunit dehydrogenase|nr:SDR family oxidoreductase [Bdellovibrionota bacterium]